MKRKSTLYLLYLLLPLIAVSACTREDTSARRTVDTIKIGVIFPFSGPNVVTGENLRAGVDLACDIINHSHSFSIPLASGEGLTSHGNLPVEIVYVDSQNNPQHAAEQVSILVEKHHVSAIMGCYNSLATAAASEQAEIMKVPFLNALSSSPLLSQRGFSWFFQTTPTDAIFAENFFFFLDELSQEQGLNVSRLLVLLFENRLFGTNVSRVERIFAGKYGFNILQSIPYDSQAEIFENELQQVQNAMPAIILQTSYSRDAVAFMRGYKARHIHPVAILGMDAGFISPCFLESLGADANFVLSREVWAPDVGRKKKDARAVNELFRARSGRNLNGNSSRAFTGLIVLADALDRAATVDNDEIRRALRETDISPEELIMPWDGVKFDAETGENLLGRGIIVQIQNEQYVTVWPRNFASASVVWPVPPRPGDGANQ